MIAQEIGKATALYDAYGTLLMEDSTVQKLLENYRKAIAATYKAMEEEGVLNACARCARGPSGSCCFQGVEDWYDAVLLLINLLLDGPLPTRREIPEACFFLGRSGCKLLGRYAFCVNFLCPKLTEAAKSAELLRSTGEELLCGWELEKEIRRRIASGTLQELQKQGMAA